MEVKDLDISKLDILDNDFNGYYLPLRKLRDLMDAFRNITGLEPENIIMSQLQLDTYIQQLRDFSHHIGLDGNKTINPSYNGTKIIVRE